MFMSKKALCEFYEEQMEDAHKTGVMFSLHVKATMMKVSHPIVFGHAVKVFYKDAFAKHAEAVRRAGRQRQQRHGRSLRQDRDAAGNRSATRSSTTCTPATSTGPSWRWSTRPRASRNLHSPSDVIVDASMPAMIRARRQDVRRRRHDRRTPRRSSRSPPSPASTRR